MHVSSNISIVHLKHTAFQVCDSTNETAINVFYKWGAMMFVDSNQKCSSRISSNCFLPYGLSQNSSDLWLLYTQHFPQASRLWLLSYSCKKKKNQDNLPVNDNRPLSSIIFPSKVRLFDTFLALHNCFDIFMFGPITPYYKAVLLKVLSDIQTSQKMEKSQNCSY